MNRSLLRGDTEIPTDDPAAALRFCQTLARITREQQQELPEEALELSVVLPCYNEADNVRALYNRLVAILSELDRSFEIVFVNDGSRDATGTELEKLVGEDERVNFIDLARNFGHQIAISAGLDFARGKGVVVMDADLQDSPEALGDLYRKWKEGYDVVYAIRTGREESVILRFAYALFYRMWRLISQIDVPLDAGDFCLMDRRVVSVLTAMPERNRFMRGIRSWVGFKQTGVEVKREGRYAGGSKYTFSDLMYLALDGFISFSYVPLRIISAVGMVISFVSLILTIFYSVKKMLYGLHPPGFATLVCMITFFAGVQLITIGVIGEYVGRIFEEVKRRPLYLVQAVRGRRFE